MSELLRRRGVRESENLGLNKITLVPAGGASHVPYLVSQRRRMWPGTKDKSSRCAYNKLLLPDELILQIADADVTSDTEAGGVTRATNGVLKDIEDLTPLSIAVAAAPVFVTEFVGGLNSGQSLTSPVLQPNESAQPFASTNP